MWSPRRVVMLSGCFLAFFLVYSVYSFSRVGRIDGLPPLPEAFWPDPEIGPVVVAPRNLSRLEGKLKVAFGEACKEQKWAIRLDIVPKNMVLAAEQFQLTPDGRVCLAPLSVALFGKGQRAAEVNTIKGEVAYLKFDRPVTTFAEIGSRKVVEAELAGRVEIVSNRRRPQRDQDLKVEIHTGPLYYHEPTHRIRTDDFVTLTDHKSKPLPHVLKGKGLEIELATEAQQRPGKKGAQPLESITGVKWAELRSAVHMTLHIDGRSGNIVGRAGERPAAPAGGKAGEGAKAAPPERATLEIKTPGRFRYELHKDHDIALFEGGVAPTGQVGRAPLQVEARRENLVTRKNDFLVSNKLTLRVRRRESKKAGPGADVSAEAIEIETVHATSPGPNVVLTSDAEGLKASGSDFFHDAARQRTVLRCPQGVHVERRDSDIRAVELEIEDVKPPPVPGQPPPRPFQKVRAVGPGQIKFLDAREKKTVKAEWQKLLTSTRENGQDVLTLTGAAEFNDPAGGQTLRADVLKVWLEEVTLPAAAGQAATTSRRPRHLDASGRVSASSKEININDANQLIVWFRDVPTATHLPGKAGQPAAAPAGAPEAKDAPPAGRVMPGGPDLGTRDQTGGNRPFDLTAKKVEVWVNRQPARSQIDKLECLGGVRVTQKQAPNQARGTQIKGDSLKMTARTEGLYQLIVTGDLGELQTDTIYLAGPEITIDQADNKAWVVGDGVMTMETRTNWQGEELAKTVPLTVHWSKSMLFDGESADFYGNIQAEQDRGRLGCQRLQVYFDRPISLRRAVSAKEKQGPARVRNMVCDRDVRIEEAQYEAAKLVRYQRLEGPTVQMIAMEAEDGAPARANNGNAVSASGPGNIRIFEAAGADPLLTPGDGKTTVKKPANTTAPTPKITYVAYGKRMDGNSKTGKAVFYENVRVLNMPCEKHDKVIDLDLILAEDLPEGSLYIKCDKMEVLDRKVGGQPVKEMEATGKVHAQGREFWARAEVVKYNQAKQQVIFDGKEGAATLNKVATQGAKAQTIVAKKIIYSRATGEIRVQGLISATGESAPGAQRK